MAKTGSGKKYGGPKETASRPAPTKDRRTILIAVPKLRKIKPPKPGRG